MVEHKCTICHNLLSENHFTIRKRNGENVRAKSCKACNLEKCEAAKEKRFLDSKYLWTRSDGSEITDPWEIMRNNNPDIIECIYCQELKKRESFMIIGSKYKPKLSKDVLVAQRETDMELKGENEVNILSSGIGMEN